MKALTGLSEEVAASVDFRAEPSGVEAMCEAPDPTEPEDLFLIQLWTHLDEANSLSVRADVMGRLEEILEYCKAAAELIKAWR